MTIVTRLVKCWSGGGTELYHACRLCIILRVNEKLETWWCRRLCVCVIALKGWRSVQQKLIHTGKPRRGM
jgi:hypothetical protein